MFSINLDSDYVKLRCEFEDDPGAADLLRAFVGLMRTQTYIDSTIANALKEVADEYSSAE